MSCKISKQYLSFKNVYGMVRYTVWYGMVHFHIWVQMENCLGCSHLTLFQMWHKNKNENEKTIWLFGTKNKNKYENDKKSSDSLADLALVRDNWSSLHQTSYFSIFPKQFIHLWKNTLNLVNVIGRSNFCAVWHLILNLPPRHIFVPTLWRPNLIENYVMTSQCSFIFDYIRSDD